MDFTTGFSQKSQSFFRVLLVVRILVALAFNGGWKIAMLLKVYFESMNMKALHRNR